MSNNTNWLYGVLADTRDEIQFIDLNKVKLVSCYTPVGKSKRTTFWFDTTESFGEAVTFYSHTIESATIAQVIGHQEIKNLEVDE